MNSPPVDRRTFIQQSAAATCAAGVFTPALQCLAGEEKTMPSQPPFMISLAEWSLHRTLRAGEIDNLGFPKMSKETFGINAIEYVNSFFKGKARDEKYLTELKQRCADLDVTSVLIMVDGEGALGDPDPRKRAEAVEAHHQWVEAAKFLGCHSIRVNAQSGGSFEEQQKLAADGLRRLTDYAAPHDINVIVENHGGLSSNGQWLAGVMKLVQHERCGTLPDFGNFCLDWSRKDEADAWYDRYQGVTELMPYAKAVSAKSHEFNEAGDETGTDFRKMMKIVLDAEYHGYVGIEYEGSAHSEKDGILKTKALLERILAEASAGASG